MFLPQSLLATAFRLMRFPQVWHPHSRWGGVLRQVLDLTGARVPTLGRAVDVTRTRDAVTITPRAGHERTVVFHHGGGFVLGASLFHGDFAVRLALNTHSRVVCSTYPLLPGAGVRSALPAARRVQAGAFAEASGPCVLLGDSAGASLVLASAQLDRDAHATAADALVLVSPWVDVTTPAPDASTIEPRDPLLEVDALYARGRAYARGAEAEWHASPLRGDLSGLPPMTVVTGGSDLLHGNAVDLAEQVRAAGGEVELHDDPALIHDAVIFGVREAAAQIRAVEQAVTRAVSAGVR